MSSILASVISFFSLLKDSIQLLDNGLNFIKSHKTFEIKELIAEIEEGNVNYGDKITLTGVFSDYVPSDRNLFIPTSEASAFLDILPCRPFDINGYYCGFMQPFGSKSAGDPSGFPVFYKHTTPRPVFSNYSGLSMELKGTITSIPASWKRLLDTKRPFGIKVEKIDLIGAETTGFGAFIWAIGKPKSFRAEKGDILKISPSCWSFISKFSSNGRDFFINGGGNNIRHGNNSEHFDTIYNFHGVNLLDEKSYSDITSLLRNQTKDYTIEAVYDMSLLSAEQIRNIKKQIGFV